MILGFDSRDFDGNLPPAGDKYEFFIGKLTEGDFLPAPGRFKRQLDAMREAGKHVSAWHFHRGWASPKEQSAVFHRWCKEYGLPEKLPVVLDLEDTSTPPSLRLVENMWQTLVEIEDWAGEVLIYTAKWYWDRVQPFILSRHDFYSRPLWEADPGPDTPEPGGWTKPKIRQRRLDFRPPGFNAMIDEDEITDEEWYRSHIKPEPDDPIVLASRVALENGVVPATLKDNERLIWGALVNIWRENS